MSEEATLEVVGASKKPWIDFSFLGELLFWWVLIAGIATTVLLLVWRKVR